MTPADLTAWLRDQIADAVDGPLILDPTPELPCVAELLAAYLPRQWQGLEIHEPLISETATGATVTGAADVFGLPRVKIEARFAAGDPVTLAISVVPEMGVTPGGLFPELTGSGLWLPLAGVALELRSADAARRAFAISSVLSPDLDELLRPLLHLLHDVAPFDGEGTIAAGGEFANLRLASTKIAADLPPLHLEGALAFVAQDGRASLSIDGRMTLDLGGHSIGASFQLHPALADQPFHVLTATLEEGDAASLPSSGLTIPLPPGLPATVRLQAIQVLIGAVSRVPEAITIQVSMDGELNLSPLPLSIRELTGAFTLWPTTVPLSGRAEIAGRIALGGADMDFTLDLPEMDFSVDADPAALPNVKQLVEELVGVSLPAAFPELQLADFSLSGSAKDHRYRFALGVQGEWDLHDLIALHLALRVIRIEGEAKGGELSGELSGELRLGDASGDERSGVIQLRAELARGGTWILSGGLAPGSTLSLPQLVSVIGIPASGVPGDLATLLIDDLSASIDTATGKAAFEAHAGLSLSLPFGAGSLGLRGGVSISRETHESPWQGKATGEATFSTLRLRIAIPLDDPAMQLRIELWLPKPGNPDDGVWLPCDVARDPVSNAIQTLTITLPAGLNIFGAIERFVNLLVPGMELDFPWPWDALEQVPLPATTIVIDPHEMSVSLAMSGDFGAINQIPGIRVDSVALNLDVDDSKIALVVEGSFFGNDEPLAWDPVSEDPPAPPLPDVGFELRYLGLGRHVALRDAASYHRVGEAVDALRHAFDEPPAGAVGPLSPLTYGGDSEWLVGFEFVASGFLRIGVVFNDPVLYGLIIDIAGPAAGILAGLQVEILYRRIAPGLGVYSLQLEPPAFLRTIELGAVTLTLPVVGIDIYTNGNFKLDLGFPYGGDFGRSFYLSMIPFAGAGGFYFASLNGATSTSVPRISNGFFDPVIELGIGLTVGIGKRIGGGPFRAELFIGVLAILEGVFATFQPYDAGAPSATFFRIRGTFAITASLDGVIDFSIIQVCFSITLYLGATVVIQCYEPIQLDVTARVSVRAKVKIGWFKISFSFSASVNVSFSIGSRSPTPWIIGDRALPARLGKGAARAKGVRMKAGPDERPSGFDWSDSAADLSKAGLAWHVTLGVGVDLDRAARPPVVVPLAGFFEETDAPAQVTLWLERVFHWLLRAWHGERPETLGFQEIQSLNAAITDSASSVGWPEIEALLANNFSIVLGGKPQATADSQLHVSLVPLPPVLKIAFAAPGSDETSIDLRAAPLIDAGVLDAVSRRGAWYSRGAQPDAPGAQGPSSAPMAERLWTDIIRLQLKELASRLRALMAACPITISGDTTSIGELYDALIYDPDPTDADRRPFFDDFIVANAARKGLLIEGAELTIPRPGGAERYAVAQDDTIESIAAGYGVSTNDLVGANLDADLLAPGSTWIIPSIRELSPDDAWQKLVDSHAPADIAAMTSRFLLHGVRLPIDGGINLYEAAGLQFDLPDADALGASVRVSRAAGAAPEWLRFASPGEGGGEGDELTVKLDENELSSLNRLRGDVTFEQNATVTGMLVARDVPVHFDLTRAIPLSQPTLDGEHEEAAGELRLLPRGFFDFVDRRTAQKLPPVEGWLAHAASRSIGADDGEAVPIPFRWVTRLDVEVSRLSGDDAVPGRAIYRLAGLDSAAQARLHRLVADLDHSSVDVTIVPAAGVAGPAESTGGLIAARPGGVDIVLFRNDADDRPDTPARADNTAPRDFLRILAESLAEEPGSFFFADVLPGVRDAETTIFAGSDKGVITLLVHFTAHADPAQVADSVHLDSAVDPSTVIRLSAPGLVEKKAIFPPDQLHFRVERPQPLTEDADALESLYSLLSFSFSGESADDDPSPPSLPLGPFEETEGVWLYEQTVPFASAFGERKALSPYAAVGQTRHLRLTWRDLFGNQAPPTPEGFPLASTYYDDVIPVSRWPGTQAAHRFTPDPAGARLVVELRLDPSLFAGGVDAKRVRDELALIAGQLEDDRLQVLLQTTLEDAGESPPPSELTARKAHLVAFVRIVGQLVAEAARLRPLEIEPGPDATIARLLAAWGLDARELAHAIRAVPLGELIAPDAGVATLRVPRWWQTGQDSLVSIAQAQGLELDTVIESLVRHHGHEPGLLAQGTTTIVQLAETAGAASPAELLYDLRDREGLFAEKKTICIADPQESVLADETIGELAVRIARDRASASQLPSTGLAIDADPADVLTASEQVKLLPDVPLLLEDRVAPPDGTSGETWRRIDDPRPDRVAGALNLTLTELITLTARRGDVVQPGVAVPWKAIAVTTAAGESLASLRRRLGEAAGETISVADFARTIAELDLLRRDANHLVPPAPVVLARQVSPRSAPAAFELEASVILQRFPREPSPGELALVHPDLRGRPAVWFAPSPAAPAGSASTLRPYAEAFEAAFAGDNLRVALGAAHTGPSSTVWAVRLGPGGYDLAVDAARPAFLSLRPLSTAPLGRKKVPIYPFTAGQRRLTPDIPDDAIVQRSYAAVDLDDWARRALALLDRLLRPASALALSEVATTEQGNRYDHLLAARAKLARALTHGLTEIIDYPDAEPARSDVTRRLMTERIGNRLASAYDIDAVALFPLATSGDPFAASGVFLETTAGPRDTGYQLAASRFTSGDEWLVMAVDVLRPAEHRVIDTRPAFQLTTLDVIDESGAFTLSFVIPPPPRPLGEVHVPIPLRDLPATPELRRQQGVPDFRLTAEGYPQINSFDDLMTWRYELDYVVDFAEQDVHTLQVFFNLGEDEPLPPMLAGRDRRLFQDLFHALAQCDATLERYVSTLQKQLADPADLGWLLDDLIALVDELADHWLEHYQRGGPPLPVTAGPGLKSSSHTYQLSEERLTTVDDQDRILRDDLRFTFTCAQNDPVPIVRVDGVTGELDVRDLPAGRREVVVTLPNWFEGRDGARLTDLPRTIGFQDLHILEKQNVRCRIKTTRNAELLAGVRTAEAFIYRTPVVTLPDRFFPSVEMDARVRLSRLFQGQTFTHPTELLAELLHRLLGLGRGRQNAGLHRRLSLTVRYGFSLAGDWSDPGSFAGETPLFFEPRLILDHVPLGTEADDPLSLLGRQLHHWLTTADPRRANAGFVIGIDLFTDESLNPHLVDPRTAPLAAADDARLLRLLHLEADFPDERRSR